MLSPSTPSSDRSSPRPTLRQIAIKAGLSVAAASMAMRNHTRVSDATRVRVQAIAKRLGYCPDPKLSTLMQHLRTHSAVEYRETIAYLSMYPDYESWRHASHHDYYLGACERAAELGYRVQIFHMGELGMTPARMNKLLTTRGIRGLLLGGIPQTSSTLKLDWKRFAVIGSLTRSSTNEAGNPLTSPLIHRITPDYYRAMLSTLHRLEHEGCKRIGLNISPGDDAKVTHLWRAAYSLFSENLPTERRIPVNPCAPFNTPTTQGSGFHEWIKLHKPDAIISAGCDFPQAYEASEGKPPPKHIRYVNMNISHADARSRGIDQDPFSIGRLACAHLTTMLQRNELGLPALPQTITVEGQWVENYAKWVLARPNRTPPQKEWFQALATAPDAQQKKISRTRS
ncbi:MAG: LacI family DNA-binding transcriptional regulator [Opitutaceae bacterium]|jgi:DNA-binding LacI/PurR family transcriptional regulator